MAEPVHVVSAHEKYGLPLAFDRAGDSLITGGFDGSIGVWSTEDWSERRRASGHEQSVNCGGLTAAGRLVTGSTDATASVWEVPDLAEASVFDDHAGTVAGLATHPADDRVATASYDSTARVWAAGTDEGEEENDALVLDGHSGNVTCVAFVGDGEHLASGGLGDTLAVWSLDDGSEQARLGGHGAAVVGATVDSTGQLWSAGYDGTLHQWSSDDWSANASFELPIDTRPTGLAAHPSDQRLAVTRDGGIAVVSSQGELVADHETSIKGVSTPLWTPDGSLLAVGGADGKVRLYE
jgi:WD40 repeat protein